MALARCAAGSGPVAELWQRRFGNAFFARCGDFAAALASAAGTPAGPVAAAAEALLCWHSAAGQGPLVSLCDIAALPPPPPGPEDTDATTAALRELVGRLAAAASAARRMRHCVTVALLRFGPRGAGAAADAAAFVDAALRRHRCAAAALCDLTAAAAQAPGEPAGERLTMLQLGARDVRDTAQTAAVAAAEAAGRLGVPFDAWAPVALAAAFADAARTGGQLQPLPSLVHGSGAASPPHRGDGWAEGAEGARSESEVPVVSEITSAVYSDASGQRSRSSSATAPGADATPPRRRARTAVAADPRPQRRQRVGTHGQGRNSVDVFETPVAEVQPVAGTADQEAALRIQSSWRGHTDRRRVAGMKESRNAAATRIQGVYRGHSVRRDSSGRSSSRGSDTEPHASTTPAPRPPFVTHQRPPLHSPSQPRREPSHGGPLSVPSMVAGTPLDLTPAGSPADSTPVLFSPAFAPTPGKARASRLCSPALGAEHEPSPSDRDVQEASSPPPAPPPRIDAEPLRSEPLRAQPPPPTPPLSELPLTEQPRSEPPRSEPPRSEPPRSEPPRSEPPRSEPLPLTEPPRSEQPRAEPPRQLPHTEPARAEAPRAELASDEWIRRMDPPFLTPTPSARAGSRLPQPQRVGLRQDARPTYQRSPFAPPFAAPDTEALQLIRHQQEQQQRLLDDLRERLQRQEDGVVVVRDLFDGSSASASASASATARPHEASSAHGWHPNPPPSPPRDSPQRRAFSAAQSPSGPGSSWRGLSEQTARPSVHPVMADGPRAGVTPAPAPSTPPAPLPVVRKGGPTGPAARGCEPCCSPPPPRKRAPVGSAHSATPGAQPSPLRARSRSPASEAASQPRPRLGAPAVGRSPSRAAVAQLEHTLPVGGEQPPRRGVITIEVPFDGASDSINSPGGPPPEACKSPTAGAPQPLRRGSSGDTQCQPGAAPVAADRKGSSAGVAGQRLSAPSPRAAGSFPSPATPRDSSPAFIATGAAASVRLRGRARPRPTTPSRRPEPDARAIRGSVPQLHALVTPVDAPLLETARTPTTPPVTPQREALRRGSAASRPGAASAQPAPQKTILRAQQP
eukprot:TRINITY_DN3516_c0_g1_i1.p1 TRINITY_DN3516_c0_g1~~TRINITY_DN3516_c0_g1_i1.p1  ORF type:complete len:1082 (+),score=238.73 TRINITY_DN3516_c0_g1_i1:89-3334(+)